MDDSSSSGDGYGRHVMPGGHSYLPTYQTRLIRTHTEFPVQMVSKKPPMQPAAAWWKPDMGTRGSNHRQNMTRCASPCLQRERHVE